MKNKTKLTQMLLLITYLILAIFSSGRWTFFLFGWISAIIGLRFVRQSTKGFVGYLLLAAATAIAMAISWNGATSMSFMGPIAEIIFALTTGLIGTLPYLIDRWLISRMQKNTGTQPYWTAFIFPLAVTAIEFFTTSGGPVGTFGASAYSQTAFLPLAQISSVFGLWLIPFLMSWFASTINRLWEAGFNFKAKRWELIAVNAVLLAFVIFGIVRPLTAPVEAETVQIAGVSLDETPLRELMHALHNGEIEKFQTETAELRAYYLEEAETLAQKGNQIVVLPEGAGIGFTEDVDAFLKAGQALADEYDLYFVMPTFALDPDNAAPAVNALSIANPDGEIVLEHVKYGGNQFEGTLAGSGELQTVETPYGTLSAIICWDADFPAIVAQAGAQDVELLIIPANDWYEVRDIHADMSLFRAIENGTAVFRQTTQGVSLAADAYGRTINRVDGFEAEAMQEVELELYNLDTLYPQIGDLFGLLSMIGFVVILIISLIVGRKRKEVVEE